MLIREYLVKCGVLVLCLVSAQAYSQTTINLYDFQEGAFFDNYAAEEVNLLPTSDEGYRFVPEELSQDLGYTNPKMNARISHSAILPAEYGPLNTEEDMDAPIDITLAVGNLSGQAGVSPSGAATYSLPIDIPSGTNGMEPSVSINYSSQAGNGILGMGWSLAASSAISRVPKTIYHHGETKGVQLDNTDVFALDGQRLMATNGQTYGSDGCQYGTEQETWVRVTSHSDANGNPETFTVETKDGMTMLYGHETAHQDLGDMTMSWLLYRTVDQYGNYVEYEYITDEDEDGARETRLDRILYTGNEAAGLEPYNEIQFQYMEREDVRTGFNSGQRVKKALVLRYINLLTNGYAFGAYSFRYAVQNGVSLLQAVQKQNADQDQLNNLLFSYESYSTVLVEGGDLVDDSWSPTTYVNTRSVYGDFNGDGFSDYVRFSTYEIHEIEYITAWTMRLNDKVGGFVDHISSQPPVTPTQFFNEDNVGIYNTVLSDDASGLVADFDGDSMDDFCMVYVQSHEINQSIQTRIISVIVYLSSSNWSPTILDMPDTIYDLGTPDVRLDYLAYDMQKLIQIGDFDGNGISDLMINTRQPNGVAPHEVYSVRSISTNENFFFEQEPNQINVTRDWLTLDVDSDGVAEIIGLKDDRVLIQEFNLGSNPSLSTVEEFTFSDFDNVDRLLTGDFNGDGLVDLFGVCNGWQSERVLLNTGTAFVESNYGYLSFEDNAVVIDINKDGLSDIVSVEYLEILDLEYSLEMSPDEYYHFYELSYKINASFNDGFQYVHESSVVGTNTYTWFLAQYDQDEILYGLGPMSTGWLSSAIDRNGDNNLEYIIDLKGHVVSFGDSKTGRLEGIRDSFGTLSSIEYEALSKMSQYDLGFAIGSSVFSTTKGFGCVEEVRHESFMNTSRTERYKYGRMLFHREGKGMLGTNAFSKASFNQDDLSDALHMKVENAFDENSLFLYPLKQNEFRISDVSDEDGWFSTDQLINANTLVDHSVVDLGSSRFNFQVTESRNDTYFEGILVNTREEHFVYSSSGNLENVTKNIDNGFAIETISNVYAPLSNWWIENKVELVTKAVQRQGQPAVSTSTFYGYNDNGSVTLEKARYGTVRETTTEITAYNSFGLPEATMMSSGSLPVTTQSFVYDNTSRNVVSKTNNLGQESNTIYHPIWNSPTEETDILGNKIEYTYDDWGRVEATLEPNGAVTNVSTVWLTDSPGIGSASAFSTNDALYKVIEERTGSPKKEIIYNRFGQELQKTIEGHFGDLTTITTYDELGRKATVSDPHYIGSPEGYTSIEYDEYGRVEEQTYHPSNGTSLSTSIAYSLEQDGLSPPQWKTITTAPDGSTTSSYKDMTGQVVKVVDRQGEVLTYEHYSDGQLKSVSINGEEASYMEYDPHSGEQTLLRDPNADDTQYEYNAYGQLVWQEDAKGNRFDLTYDDEGRLTAKHNLANTDGPYMFSYVDNGYGLNQIKRETAPNGNYTEYEYGEFNRVLSVTEHIGSEDFLTSFEYDNLGQVILTTYPNGYQTRNQYDPNGYLTAVIQESDQTVIWSPTSQNARGIYDSYALGNGYTSTTTLDTYGRPTQIRAEDGAQNFIQDLSMSWTATTGNLEERTDHIKGLTDEFQYDQDRLSEWKVVQYENDYGINTASFSTNGNIYTKSDASNSPFNYGLDVGGLLTKPHALTSVSNAKAPLLGFDQEITYTDFNSTTSISNDSDELRLDILYGADEQRRYQVKQAIDANDVLQPLQEKYFVGSFEKQILHDGQGNTTTREIIYIAGGNGLRAMHVTADGQEALNYLYTDHLGSIVTVTDASGAVVHEQNFDAWGRYRNVSDWSYENPDPSSTWAWFDRGYTGHEMLPEFGLINMNGRAYDPVLGRMLQVDNYVQDPYSSQSYNRYSYTWNNPLKYTDPSGEVIALAPILIGMATGALVGGAISGVVYTVNAALPGQGFDIPDFARAVAFGALGGAVSGGLGALGAQIGISQNIAYNILSSVSSNSATTLAFGGDVSVGSFVGMAAGGLVGTGFGNYRGVNGGVFKNVAAEIGFRSVKGAVSGGVGGAVNAILDGTSVREGFARGASRGAIAGATMASLNVLAMGASFKPSMDFGSFGRGGPVYRRGTVLTRAAAGRGSGVAIGRNLIVHKLTNKDSYREGFNFEDYNKYLMAHETGHFQQQKNLGYANFYFKTMKQYSRIGLAAVYGVQGTLEYEADRYALQEIGYYYYRGVRYDE